MSADRIVSVSSAGLDPRAFIQKVEAKLHFEFQAKLYDLAEKCVKRMQELLNRSGYNLTDLASKIKLEVLNDVGGLEIGIGKIDEMPKYWEWFNAGFQPKSTGKFVPLGSFPDGAPDSKKSGGKWTVGGKFTFMDDKGDKKAVLPIKYIDIAEQELDIEIAKTVAELTRGVE